MARAAKAKSTGKVADRTARTKRAGKRADQSAAETKKTSARPSAKGKSSASRAPARKVIVESRNGESRSIDTGDAGQVNDLAHEATSVPEAHTNGQASRVDSATTSQRGRQAESRGAARVRRLVGVRTPGVDGNAEPPPSDEHELAPDLRAEPAPQAATARSLPAQNTPNRNPPPRASAPVVSEDQDEDGIDTDTTERDAGGSEDARGREDERARHDDREGGDENDDGESEDVDEAGSDDAIDFPRGSPIGQFVARLSDRAVQRLVGGNAFLRGRLYARRGGVTRLHASGEELVGNVRGRGDEPYTVEVLLGEGNLLRSKCMCPAWKGPTGHCKHVTALIIALRDRERPPKPRDENAAGGHEQNNRDQHSRDQGNRDQGSRDQTNHHGGNASRPQQGGNHAGVSPTYVSNTTGEVVLVSGGGAPQTVSVGGKRRRSRRRRGGRAEPVEIVSLREPTRSPGTPAVRIAGPLDAWMSPEDNQKPLDLEYRLVVRPAALAVTPVIAGTRSAVPPADLLAGARPLSREDRPVVRSLARAATRLAAATGEFRGEEAADLISELRGRRVLIEPASAELRFADEPLRPKIELDSTPGVGVRVRVVFELKSTGRRFPLSSGAWFEGTPSWYIDTVEGVARPVADVVSVSWLQRLHRSPAIVVPLTELPKLLGELIPRIATLLSADLPELTSFADVVDGIPRIQLRGSGDIIEARIKLRALYESQTFDIPPATLPSPLGFLPSNGSRPRVVRRDVGGEVSAVAALRAMSFEIDQDTDELVAKGDAAIKFWTDGIRSLPESWERLVPADLAAVLVRDTPVSARMRVSSGVDWLNLDMGFDSGGVAVDEEELRACLEKGRRLVKLADGSYAPVRADQVGEVLARMAEIVATAGTKQRVPLSQAGRVQDLLRLVSDTQVATPTKDLFSKFDDIGQIEPVAKPRTVKAELRPYQKEGFSWLVFLHQLNTGGILADDMGLGKTLQTISLLCWLKGKEIEHPSLVVAPTSVVPNWEREIAKFAPSLKTLVWHGPDRHDSVKLIPMVDVVITSFALLRRDEELLQKHRFAYAILDEAQHIKNPLSATARSAKRITADRRLALTGTPIENRLSEFWSIFDFVSPNMLGSLKTFEEQYARPIERGDVEIARKLGSTVRPFVKRRTKSEVEKDLPPKIEQEIIVPLAEEQARLYRQMMREIRDSLLSEVEEKGVNRAQIQILAALTRLRQIACDPRLLKLPGDWDHDESGKLSALRQIVSEAVDGGHRVLVFSQFVEMLKIIRDALDADGVKYEYLDGSTIDRQARVDRFNNDPKLSVFLISLKAGGTGLNLTGADTVIHFDPWWNPAVEDQATDRAHRIGQRKVVSVYRLIAKGTVEEKILQLSAKKRSLVENVFSSDASGLKGLTREDVDDLFAE